LIEETIYLCDENNFDEDGNTLTKYSYRAIILNDDKILLAHVNRYGDYRFPGGKIDEGETVEDGLIREVLEEVGGIVTSIVPYAHIVTKNIEKITRNFDFFILDSFYYICKIEDELVVPNLDEAEIRDGFNREWISVTEAIAANKKVLNSNNVPLVIQRETRMLEIIRDRLLTKQKV